jgi:hypothetical protein
MEELRFRSKSAAMTSKLSRNTTTFLHKECLFNFSDRVFTIATLLSPKCRPLSKSGGLPASAFCYNLSGKVFAQLNGHKAMKVLIDDEIIGRLGAVREAVELRDGNGRTFGYFHPVVASKTVVPEGLRSPISDEELARRAASPGGRPLAKILQDVAKR